MKDAQFREYSRYLDIDDDRLDEEVSRLPGLFFTVSDLYSEACYEVDCSKQDLESIMIDVRKRILDEHERLGENLPMNKLEKLVESERSVRKAKKKHIRKKYTAERWMALKDGYLQKSYMLRNKVRLMLESNNQSASLSGNENRAHDLRADQGRKAMASARRSKRKKLDEKRR